MENSRRNWINLWDCLLLIAVIIVIGLIVSTNLFHYCYKMNADIASETLLARLIWESGEWIPKSWYPSTELRIFGTPNLAALFYGITSNMSLAMGLSCVTMTVGIVISGYFFISQFSFDRTQRIAFLLLCLILPNHFVVLELFYLFAAYYGIHVIVLFFTLGVYARLLSGKQCNILYMASAVILAFMMGMQGLRGILILNAPLLATELLRQLYLVWSKSIRKDKQNLLVGIWCASLLLAGYVGTIFPFSVGQEVSRNMRNGVAKLFKIVLPDAAVCLGLSTSNWGGVSNILYFVLLLITTAVFVLCVVRVLKKQCNDHTIWIYMMLWISTIMTMLAAAFTTAESSQRNYFAILFAVAFGFTYIMKWAKEKSPILNGIGCALIIVLLTLHIYTVYGPILHSKEPVPNTEYKVCEYLEESGFQMAYADFEYANTMTVLSEGAIQVAAVASMEKMDICKWLNSEEWYVPNVPYESRTAYIVTEAELDSFNKFCKLHNEDIRFDVEIGKFFIYESDYNFSCLE